MASFENDVFPWELGVCDAHCHPTDVMSSTVDGLLAMKTRILTIMATRTEDQELVASVASRLSVPKADVFSSRGQLSHSSARIIPSFGWHPWFSHLLYDDRSSASEFVSKEDHYKQVLKQSPAADSSFLSALPDPLPLSGFLTSLRGNLERFPHALVGELGLDKVFALPLPWSVEQLEGRDMMLTPGGRETRGLSPYHVRPEHQKAILQAQLNVAGEMQRSVSVHGVQAHGLLFESLRETWKGFENEVVSNRTRKRRGSVEGAHSVEDEINPMLKAAVLPFPPRICLHSYSGPPDALREYLHASVPADVYYSFSMLINFAPATATRSTEVIKALPDDKILAESDLHAAGQEMDDLLKEVILRICSIKGWDVAKGVLQLRNNWVAFVFGKT
ncbi:MAG: hypothetical protein M1814_002772 [Vezdaea aestivalis]|nr:MAG: hypothetical protein M1814_002772 [Vezdaea aestivalis]